MKARYLALVAAVLGVSAAGYAQRADDGLGGPGDPARGGPPDVGRPGPPPGRGMGDEGVGPGAGGPFGGRAREGGGGQDMEAEGMIMAVLNSPAMARELGLTDEQIAPLKDGFFELREKEIGLKAEMEKAGLEQARLMTEKEIDEAAVMAAVEKAGAIRTEMAKLRVKGLLLVKRSIPPEQIEKIRDAFREKMRDRFRQRRDGVGFQGPPQSVAPRDRRNGPAAWHGGSSREGGGNTR